MIAWWKKEGWIFVEDGDAFAAVRVVAGNDDVPGLQGELVNDSYTWNPDRTIVQLNNKYAGMIFETSRRAHHETIEAFMEDILDNTLMLDKTVVAGFHILRYQGCGEKCPGNLLQSGHGGNVYDWRQVCGLRA